jgi:glyoxylase-like metal-dependent hydrolase (beta-lactamase superfamily II)
MSPPAPSSTWSLDPATRRAAIIDPVFDYDHNSGTVDTRSVEAMLKAAEEAGYAVEWALETHAHADHLSGAHQLYRSI